MPWRSCRRLGGGRRRRRALRITSPLGRTGLTGTIRIVARLDAQWTSAPRPVDFYVDQLLLASDLDGPPYEALWADDNPFERRELTARAEFDAGLGADRHGGRRIR